MADVNSPLRLSNSTTIIEHGDSVVLGNSNNGLWIRAGLECYNILKNADTFNLSLQEISSRLADDSDREYFGKFADSLKKIGCISLLDEEKDAHGKTFMFEITNRCNLSCKHCSYNVNYSNSKECLTLEQLKSIIRLLVSCNAKNIVLTGGEPLVRTDFLEFFRFLSDNHTGKIGMMTNGTLLDESLVREVSSRVNTVDISLDGANETTCSAIRGAGIFKKVINAVKMLQKYGVKDISLSMVDAKITNAYISDFLKLNEELGTRPLIREFEAVGSGLINKESLYIEKSSNEDKHYSLSNEEIRRVASELFVRKCGACRKVFTIDCVGDLYPCSLLTEKKFMLLESLYDKGSDTFAKFIDGGYEQSEGHKTIKNCIPTNCVDCNVNEFCFNCVAHLYNSPHLYHGVNCSTRKRLLKQAVWGESV